MQKKEQQRSIISLYVAALCACLLVAGTASAAQNVVLTAVQGQASVQNEPLTERGELAEDQPLETGDDGGCSVLLDENAVVEMCAGTRISFARDPEKGNRIVNIESGSVRLVVEPREPGERIEIHTPAAIATILGSIVYVTVDPVTKKVTISSSQSDVKIQAKDATGVVSAQSTTISAFEQFSATPGGVDQQKRTIDQRQIERLGGCLLEFRDLAVGIDRVTQEGKSAQRAVEVEVAVAVLPPVGGGAPPAPPGGDFEVPVVELDPQDVVGFTIGGPCGDIPGEHCEF